MYYVYLLECADGSIYTGITTDIKRRFKEHAAGKGGRFTAAKKAKRMLYCEPHPDRSTASKREAEIKKWSRDRKLALSGQQAYTPLMNEPITVEAVMNAAPEKVWKALNDPEAMKSWGSAGDGWHTVSASCDLKVGGRMTYRMEAKDGSAGFDLGATYEEVVPNERLAYVMDDGRKVSVVLVPEDGTTRVRETFEPENENAPEFQRAGWQAILDNLKRYVEAS